MPINIQDYLLGRIPVGRKIDIPAYLMAKAASGGGIQEVSGTLPLTVRSRASQILKNYIIYGTASGAGVRTENLLDVQPAIIVTSYNDYYAEYRISGDAKTQIINELNSHLNEEYSISLDIATEYTGYIYFELVLYYADSTVADIYGTRQFTPTKEVVNIDIRARYNNASGNGKTFTFNNVMIVKGSTAPSIYIPYGYKLPLKVTADGTTTDYPVYIGDSQLGEEEYVDYESGKVWKRTENLFDYTAKDTTNGFGENAYLFSNGLANSSRNYNISEYIKVLPNTTYTIASCVGRTPGVCEYDSNKTYITGIAYNEAETITFTTTATTNYIRFSIRITIDTETMVVQGSTPPESYIPYLQPTDPPVPLPDITIPKGEVTVDTEEEVKPQATIKGKIEQI